MIRYFQEYVEPVEGQTSQSGPRRDHNPLHPQMVHTESDKVQLPLGENTLTNNLGVPIVVVLTQVRCHHRNHLLLIETNFKQEDFDKF